jgi:hypothetical protein
MGKKIRLIDGRYPNIFTQSNLKIKFMKLNCVVVDDSSIQRIIAKLVNNHQNLEFNW